VIGVAARLRHEGRSYQVMISGCELRSRKRSAVWQNSDRLVESAQRLAQGRVSAEEHAALVCALFATSAN